MLMAKLQSTIVERVVLNLLYNALNACKTTTWLKWYIQPQDKALIIDVVDDGEGIPKPIATDLFKDKFTFGKLRGSGMGLYASEKYVKEMGGTLTYFELSGRTCFRIQLLDAIPSAEMAKKAVLFVVSSKELENHFESLIKEIEQPANFTIVNSSLFRNNFRYDIVFSNEPEIIRRALDEGKIGYYAKLSDTRESIAKKIAKSTQLKIQDESE